MDENNTSLNDFTEEKEENHDINFSKENKKPIIKEIEKNEEKETKETKKPGEIKEISESAEKKIDGENETTEIKADLPKVPVEIVKLKKSGSITIPKKIRDKLQENQMFACWEENSKIIFQQIKEFQIQDLNLVKTKSSTTKEKAKKSKTAKRSKKKGKTTGPQPELTKYFPFQIDNQEKILSILESTFYILIEDPPKVKEAIERIRYIIINYTSGISRNDDRLKNTVILFISDIFEKITNEKLKELLNFAKENIVFNIHSKFLREQGLITLFITSIRANSTESEIFLKNILEGISEYKEPYQILQGFKGLVRSIIKSKIELNDDLKFLIRDEMRKFILGYEETKPTVQIKGETETAEEETEIIQIEKLNTDNSLQLIELIEDMHLIEDAYKLADNLLKNIPPEDIKIEAVRTTLSRLKKTHI
ncbi:MAG: hypothetical protein ACTSYY_03090 [Promethearchaeota archaeon]